MIDFLENLIAALSEAKRRILNGCADFIRGLVELLEVLYEVFVEIVQAIWEYLVRFFVALNNLLWVLIQLFLFYVPAIGMYYFFSRGAGTGWLVGSIVWVVIVTLAGLFYRKEKDTET